MSAALTTNDEERQSHPVNVRGRSCFNSHSRRDSPSVRLSHSRSPFPGQNCSSPITAAESLSTSSFPPAHIRCLTDLWEHDLFERTGITSQSSSSGFTLYPNMTSSSDSSSTVTASPAVVTTTTTASSSFSSTVMSVTNNNKPASILSMKQEQQQHQSDPNQSSLGNTTSSASSSPPNSSPSSSSTPKICYACNKVIYERFLLKAMDEYWHEDCLKCSCCGCRLGEVGSTLFTKHNLILCKRDYLRLFGSTGTCLVCDGNIPAFELVMKVRGHNMHLECFKCQECNHRFCVGDKFYLYNNTKVLCEYHYEERMVFASLPQNSLEQIKRSTHEFLEAGGGSDGASSGYGSHSESPYTEHR